MLTIDRSFGDGMALLAVLEDFDGFLGLSFIEVTISSAVLECLFQRQAVAPIPVRTLTLVLPSECMFRGIQGLCEHSSIIR